MSDDARFDDPETQPSRRRFLSQLAAGGALALAGCGRRQVMPSTEDAPALELRAARFSGAPDGRTKEIWGYNGQLPGPTIRAKEGDTLRVNVVNELGVPTTVHWHGMYQKGTWRMDGVENVSGLPILQDESFLYEFKAEPAGTHWYHSHAGVQYANGLFGPLIVEERTPIAAYDRDEVLLINDWFLQPADTLLAHLLDGKGMGQMDMKDVKGVKDVGDIPFQSGLINGKGRAPGDTKSPLTVIEVKKGETVRLRLINGSSTYYFRFQIDGLPLTIIASDGAPVIPAEVDNLVLAIGETYDVLIKADLDGPRWIRAVTLDGNEVLAVLRPKDSQAGEPEMDPVRWGPRHVTAEALRAREPADLSTQPREMPILLGGSMRPYRWSINGAYYLTPEAAPFVIQNGEHIRMKLTNPTDMDHPFHLHGHDFHVLGPAARLNMRDPARKNTINVPAKGEVVIQWLANNPGRWFFHCHIEWHLMAGMARIINLKPYH